MRSTHPTNDFAGQRRRFDHRVIRPIVSTSSSTLCRCSTGSPETNAPATQCRHVIAQDLLLDLVQRGAHGVDLGQHIDAVAVLLDHAQHAAHLALDPLQPRRHGLLCRIVHLATIPRRGISTAADAARNRESNMHRHDHHAAAMADRDPATDPVCGMTVDPATSRHRFEHARQHVPFLLRRLPRQIRRRPGPVPDASRRTGRRHGAPSTPARCTPRSARSAPAVARSAAWRWSR